MTIVLRHLEDVLVARQAARRIAAMLPFSPADLGRIDVAAAELASNVVKHAGHGQLQASQVAHQGRRGVRLLATDQGPGISCLAEALTPGHSTAGTLGNGLPAVRELMDDFRIESTPAEGTRVEATKWAP